METPSLPEHISKAGVKTRFDWYLMRKDEQINTAVQEYYFSRRMAYIEDRLNFDISLNEKLDILHEKNIIENKYFSYQIKTGIFKKMPSIEFLILNQKFSIFAYRHWWEKNSEKYNDIINDLAKVGYVRTEIYRKRLFNFNDVVILSIKLNAKKKTKTKSENRKRLHKYLKMMYPGNDYRCVFCGIALTKNTATLEHIHPNSHGGGWTIPNITISCDCCNNNRGTEDFYTYLARCRGTYPNVEKIAV